MSFLDYFEAYYSLAIVFEELGELKTAIEYLEKVVAIQPNLAEVHNKIGTILIELGQFEQAVISLQNAIKIRPK